MLKICHVFNEDMKIVNSSLLLIFTYIQYVTAFCQYGLFSENFPILSVKSKNWQQQGASNITATNPINLE